MKKPLTPKSFVVFVTKFLDSKGMYKDEVIQTEVNRFKSTKFRHTFYEAHDFNTNIENMILLKRQKDKKI